jgi:hypothetical protein
MLILRFHDLSTLCQSPCTEGKDGIIVKVATWKDIQSKEAFQFLNELPFGAVVFPLGADPLPPTYSFEPAPVGNTGSTPTLKVTSTHKISSSPNIIQVSVDALTGWYILDLMVVKEDIKECTLSTTEAEYFALPMSLQDVLPIMFLLDEMKCKSSQVICTVPHVHCKIFEYNSESLELARLLKLRPHTKHINVCYHHFREHVRSRKVKIFPLVPRIKLQMKITTTKHMHPTSQVHV